jgi:hypothetical protein
MSRARFVGTETLGRAIAVAVTIAGLAGGCAELVRPELMVPQLSARPAARIDKTVAVAKVTGGVEASTPLTARKFVVEIGNEEFQAALIQALDASGLFRSVLRTETSDYQLEAHIVSMQPQRAGFLTMTSSLVVNYRLREIGTGRDVWHETIISQETAEGAPFTEGLPGAIKKSLAGAARQNLAEMIEKLSRNVPVQ